MSPSRSLLSGRRLAVGLTVGFVGAAVGAIVASGRRWAGNDSPSGGDPLHLGDGIDSICVTDDGARLAVRVLGTGTAGDVVLPHCWMGSRRFWGPVAERLTSSGHRVVVYDQRGHGASTVGGAGYTLDALADDLDAVLHHLELHDVVIAGHSLGGMTTQAFLIRHPATVRRMVRGVVLVSTACEFKESADRFRRLEPFIGHRAMTPIYANPILGPLTMRSIEGRQPSMAHLEAQVLTILETPPEVRIAFLRAMATMDLEADLAAVDIPAIVLVGSRDQVTPPERSRRIVAALPGARLEVLPDLGHMLLWDAPDRIVDAIVELESTINLESPRAAAEPRR